MENPSVARVHVQKVRNHQLLEADDALAVEEPLEIGLQYGSKDRLVTKAVSVTMRTPGHDQELALGFLWTEGIISRAGQVARTSVLAGENKVVVTLNEHEVPALQPAERNFYTTSSCGVCGKASIGAIRTVSPYPGTPDQIAVAAGVFYGLEDELRKQQRLFASTGGLHASALFDLAGKLIMLREDVGRHNALDKVIGAALLEDALPLDRTILLLSGRASFELVQKATMAGIKLVAAVGAPSSLAVQLAQEAGMTLIGFLRHQGFNIYAGAHRVKAGLVVH
ncbi:MAG: formate dehydrogenase accessory sulfurtransferase FdhD [Cytophagales bacterium]|nr:formate dehydrogenase accessory sulfurtransferase FdhD [Cytophagales bacterium]